MHVPKLRRRPGRDTAFVEWKGKRIPLGRWGKPATKKAYRDWLNANVFTEPGAPGFGCSVARLTLSFLVYAETYYGEGSELGHFRQIVRDCVDCHTDGGFVGDLSVNAFGPNLLKAVRQRLVARKCAYTYINSQIRRLRQVFAWGVESELVRSEVYATLLLVRGLRRGKSEAKDPAPVACVPWATVEATLPYLSATVAAMVQVQYLTDCRPGEVCSMRPCDIDKGDIWVYQPAAHKTQHRGKSKAVPIGPKARAILEQWEPASGTAYYFAPARAAADRAASRRAARASPLTPSQAARKPRRKYNPKYTTRAYRRAIWYGLQKAAAANVGIAHWHPHQLRHTRSSEVRARFGLEGSVALTGNTVPAAQLYAERDFELACRIALETG